MKKYNFYTNDARFMKRLKSIIDKNDYNVLSYQDFTNNKNYNEAYVYIIDSQDICLIKRNMNRILKKDKGIILLCDDINPKDSVDLLNKGISAIIYKSEKANKIRKILENTMENIVYLKELKNIVDKNKKLKELLFTLKSLTSDKDISEIINIIMRRMIDSFDLKLASFYVLKKNILRNRLNIGKNIIENIKLNKNLEKIIKNKEVVLVKKNVILGNNGKGYFILIPIYSKSRAFGLIILEYISNNIMEKFKNDKEILIAFGEQISIAIENASLYWDILSTREKLIKKEKEALLGQMIVSLNHEISNPLTIISMEAQLLQKKIKEEKTDNINGRLTRIENNIERIKSILEKITTLKADKNNVIEYIKGKEMINLYDEN